MLVVIFGERRSGCFGQSHLMPAKCGERRSPRMLILPFYLSKSGLGAPKRSIQVPAPPEEMAPTPRVDVCCGCFLGVVSWDCFWGSSGGCADDTEMESMGRGGFFQTRTVTLEIEVRNKNHRLVYVVGIWARTIFVEGRRASMV